MDDEKTTPSFVRKPPWLSAAAFDELIRNHGGVPRCAKTDETQDLSIDHIIPRYNGGTDDVSNLQFLVSRLNAQKGTRPDTYWSQQFYWDRSPNLDAFRTAQRELFQTIVDEEWFRLPISQIARQLYLNAWVVGAGKTLGIAAAAWATNHVIRDQWGAAPRADRILVVAKEQAVRDQLAHDLEYDLVKYGITPVAPRVALIKEGHQLTQTGWLDAHDIVVTCGQMLWERKGGRATETDVAEKLAGFRVIAFDEPHFAWEQVNRLIDLATQSLCFGFTGTPIDGAGALLDKMVALSIHDYDTAATSDRGLRWLDNQPELFDSFVRVLGINEAELIEYGERGITDDANKVGYKDNIAPCISVARAVIAEMKQRDQLILSGEKVAPHRGQPDVVMGGVYPAHGMVVCETVDIAKTLRDNSNELFVKYPDTYPRTEGWYAEAVYTDGEDASGKRRGAKPLTSNHKWLCAKNNDYAVDDQCARLLFVVGMAREGVNNPACGPIGMACSQSSLVDWVQRAIGRQLRAITSRCGDSLIVPPAPLDSVRIITHISFNNVDAIRRAIDFVCNMSSYLAGLPIIDDLTGQDPVVRDTQDREFGISWEGKLNIAGKLGEPQEGGSLPSVDDVIDCIVGPPSPGNEELRNKARDWANKLQKDPEGARRELRLCTDLPPKLIVTREHVREEPSDADLERHLKIHHPNRVEKYVPIQAASRDLITDLYVQHAQQFYLPPLTSTDHVDDLRQDIAQKVFNRLGDYFQGERGRVHFWVGAAVKQTLGTRGAVRNNSDWDIPQVHAMLRRSDVQADIIGWVTDKLIDDGLCPALATFLRRTRW